MKMAPLPLWRRVFHPSVQLQTKRQRQMMQVAV